MGQQNLNARVFMTSANIAQKVVLHIMGIAG